MAEKAFVTGGTGFLGLNLIEQLAKEGWEVVALHRPSSELSGLKAFPARLVEGSLDDADALARAMGDGVDAVFHMAGDTSLWKRNNARQDRTNIDGTRNMAEAALRAGAKRFVHTSTWNVFGLEGHDAISETTPRTGRGSWVNYTHSKALAEEAVRDAIARGLPAVILNPSHIIGRYDTSNWARMFTMVNENRLPGIPPGAGSFCHAERVAKAHVAAAVNGRIGENYLLGGVDAPFTEVIAIIGELTGRKVPKRPLPAPLVRLVARLKGVVAAVTGREPDLTPEAASMILAHPRIASDKAERELGYRPATLREMLEDCYRWMVAEGLLGSSRN